MQPVLSPLILIGVDKNNHNYHLLDPESGKIYITHDATFQPLIFLAHKTQDHRNQIWDITEEEAGKEDDTVSINDDQNIEMRRAQEEDDTPPSIIPLDPTRSRDGDKELAEEEEGAMKSMDEEEYDKHIELDIVPLQNPLGDQLERKTSHSNLCQVRTTYE
ncbi:hypothetical protein CROQUDRAFT_100175 [Cronartium quercuum f. sp. fusiforme G11]|uniref:Retroviral polymerase SH3-like domain-containing protein n=1 Tax=Cronartium quercuum f. sp. fusiforme G11 TaxID=708437 RepID=A0A9P6NA10_9BASI|nr:hypothetical protein CROQUDRAFT_100175 [Cronartium quercuum f. sp. fusiforme G11]